MAALIERRLLAGLGPSRGSQSGSKAALLVQLGTAISLRVESMLIQIQDRP